MTRPLPLILLCGDSLLLAGLEAGLRGAAGVQALHLPAATAPDAARLPAGGVLLQAETGLEQHAPCRPTAPA